MKVYLAGPRTGKRDYNRPVFDAAAADLRDRGIDVLNPCDLDQPGEMANPISGGPQPAADYNRGLERCIREMLKAEVEAVVVLSGWEQSRGARLEVQVAEGLGKPVLAYPHLDPLPERHPSSARFHEILRELGDLHDRKQQDYGRVGDPFANVRAAGEWGIKEWIGALIRASDKIRRLQTFAQTGQLANEGVVDAFDDLAVYAVIARVLFEESAGRQDAPRPV